MIIDIDITFKDLILTITDNSLYQNEDSTAIVKDNYKFSECMSVTVVEQDKLSEREVLVTAVGRNKRLVAVYIPFDGCFTITHFIIPTTEWLNNEAALFYEKNKIIYGDGEFIYYKGNTINAECLLQMDLEDTTVLKLSKDYISINNLRSLFIDQCSSTFKNRINNKDTSCDLGDLWSTINLLEYYSNKNQLKEIERIIEKCYGTRNKGTCHCLVQ